MKIVPFFALLLSVFICCVQKSDEKPIKITVHISAAFTQESQWVYWFSHYGNEMDIQDSLYLQKGQTSFVFEKNINEGQEEYNAYIAFSKNGPIQLVMKLVPGDNVTVFIDEKTKAFYPKVEGSLACEEKYCNRMLIDSVAAIVRNLTDSLIQEKDKLKIFELKEQIKQYNNYINRDSYFEFFKKAKSPLTAYSMLDIISYKYPNENIDKHIVSMKSRFPKNKKIQDFPNYKPFPSASERSKLANIRYEQLINARKKGFPNSPVVNSSMNDKKTIEDIKPYQIGNKVDSISLKGLKGNYISINEINTKYILIDFWATWCAPCRKEIPYLKKVVEKYPNLITIYAISFDNREEEWIKTIEIDQSEMFTHVYGGILASPKTSILQAKFGVNAIPANFLLNQNRKIIAVDLRGDALMKKMDELTRD